MSLLKKNKIINSFILVCLSFSLAACSIYKSEDRKKFEDVAPQKVKISSIPILQNLGCKQESTIESWIKSEFPTDSYELNVADTEFEIWSTTKAPIRITGLLKNDNVIQSCTYLIENKILWDLHRDQIIQQIENNLSNQELYN